MKKKALQFVIGLLIISNGAFAQQWIGSNVTTGDIYRDGNVGIGTTTPRAGLSLGAGNVGKRLLVYDNPATNVQSGFGIDMSNTGGRELTLFHPTNDNVSGRISFGRVWEQNGAYTETMRLTGDGKVGIGITQPMARLELPDDGNASLRVGVVGNRANTNTQLSHSLAVIGNDNQTVASNGAVAWDFYNDGNSPSWSGALLLHYGTAITGNANGVVASNQGTLMFQNVSTGVIATNGPDLMLAPRGAVSAAFLGNGNVGIGTTDTKGYKLAVNGSAIFTRVMVKAYDNWPDYVFQPNYRLRSLSEVEQYINQYHHLPEVISAEDAQKNGLDVSDNQAALLKKIEELTLYVIEQDKQMKKLATENKEMETLKKEVEALKAAMREVRK